MLTIHKYPLPVEAFDDPSDDENFPQPRMQIDTYRGFRPLKIQLQEGIPTLWALVETSAPTVKRSILLIGTGWPISQDSPEAMLAGYIDSIQQGSYVWHFFLDRNEMRQDYEVSAGLESVGITLARKSLVGDQRSVKELSL
jgi:hypothetical protein